MMRAYDQICAYMTVYIEKVTGAATVDHMIPRSVEWRQVYEWDNYRLACSLMNSRKNDAIGVLDPFHVKSGWFELEFVSFQVKPATTLSASIRNRVEKTIARLRLNDRECQGSSAILRDRVRDETNLTRTPHASRAVHRPGITTPGVVAGG